MYKNSNLAIVASFFGLWIDSFFSDSVQIIVGFLLILTFGILHGANDLLLIQQIDIKKKNISIIKLTFSYVQAVLVGAVLFYIFPLLALLLFIVVSAYHFGEQHWQNILKNFNKSIVVAFHFTYGSFILLLLFAFHTTEVSSIIFEITSYNIVDKTIISLLKIMACLLLLLLTYFQWNSIELRKKIVTELFSILILAVLFFSSSLIWGFALYFVLWHSIPSIMDQTIFLHGGFNFTLFLRYCKSALVYWLVSLIGIGILYLFLKDEKIFNAIFFSFLAAITFPHALVIFKMLGSRKNEIYSEAK
jgi:beta-carotene 15,15'-dioxygenase